VANERRDRDDWLREWNEVQDHRYDPGHWLGRIHPFYRRLAATGTSVSLGLGLIAIGLLSAAAALWRPPLPLRAFFGLLAAMFMLLGISNVRAARRASRHGRGTIKEHDPRRDPGHDPRE
jgi:multisubunit Na+/H+ antiporter MnhG subunit